MVDQICLLEGGKFDHRGLGRECQLRLALALGLGDQLGEDLLELLGLLGGEIEAVAD